MLRDPKAFKKATITVVLKDGGVFSQRGITSAPFGDNGEFVCFWDNAVLTSRATEADTKTMTVLAVWFKNLLYYQGESNERSRFFNVAT